MLTTGKYEYAVSGIPLYYACNLYIVKIMS